MKVTVVMLDSEMDLEGNIVMELVFALVMDCAMDTLTSLACTISHWYR